MKQSKDSRAMSASEKAALMLFSLGKETAAEVMKHLSKHEVKRLSRMLLSVNEVSRSDQLVILSEFQRLLSASDKLLVDGKGFATELMTETFGAEAAGELTEFGRGPGKESLESMLGEIPETTLKDAVLREHPQTVAYLLSQMHPDQGARILSMLSDDEQTETLLRVSQLAQVSQAVADEVREVLRKEVSAVKPSGADIPGKKVAAELLSRMNRNNEERVLSEIEEMYPDLADEMRELMFTYEDLTKLDSKSIQNLMKEVPRDQLLLSFKMASEELIELFLSNVSVRAREMLLEDLNALPPTKRKDVEQAQQGIIDIARRLEAEGKIVLAESENEEWV